MPTRTAMVLALNGRGSRGDPFIGLLARGVFAVGKGILRTFRKAPQKVLTAGAAIARRAPAGSVARRVATGVVAAGAAGAAFEAGARVIGTDAAGQPVFARKRRRRGLSATEIRGFKRTLSLLTSLGMMPRSPRKRGHGHVVLSK